MPICLALANTPLAGTIFDPSEKCRLYKTHLFHVIEHGKSLRLTLTNLKNTLFPTAKRLCFTSDRLVY